MASQSLALLLGILLIGMGILGLSGNSFIGESSDAIFHADLLQNALNIGSGVLFLFIALLAPGGVPALMIIVGIIYVLLGILGLIDLGTGGTGKVLGMIEVNTAGSLLQLGLGLVSLVGGVITRKAMLRNNYN